MVIAQEAERAAKLGQMKGVRDATRRLCNGPQKEIDMVRNKTGKPLTNEEKVQPRWKEHLAEDLNRPNPAQVAEVVSQVPTIEEIPS